MPNRYPRARAAAGAVLTVMALAMALAAAPLPGPDARARDAVRPPAVAADAFGARGQVGLVALQPALGARRTVIDLRWPDVQPTPPADPDRVTAADFDFSAVDRQVDAIAAAGQEPQFRLMTCATTATGAPFWATVPLPPGVPPRPNDPCTSMPARRDAWLTAFVFQTVRHYRDYRHPVRFFAVLNEVDADAQWPGVAGRQGCTPDPPPGRCPLFEDYLHLLRRAYAAAHAANSAAVVLDSGISSPATGLALARVGYERGGRSPAALRAAVAFVNSYFRLRYIPGHTKPWIHIDPDLPPAQLKAAFLDAAQDRQYYVYTHMYRQTRLFDAVQLHSYDAVENVPDVLGFLRAEQAASGRTRPVQCWECGTKWALLPRPGTPGVYYRYDAPAHAATTVKRAATLLAAGVRQFVYIPLAWTGPVRADLPSVSGPLVCTPIATAEPGLCPDGSRGQPWSVIGSVYRAMVDRFAGATAVTAEPGLPAGVSGYRFRHADADVVVVWADQPRTVDLTRLGPVLDVRDQLGAPRTEDAGAFPLTPLVSYVLVRH